MDISPGRVLVNRHWRMILAVAVLASLVAFGASYLWSPQYAAVTHVLVRARATRFLTSNGQDLSQQPGVVDASLAKSLDDTYSAMLTSRTTAEHVVNTLHLDKRRRDLSFLGQARADVKHAYNVVKDIVVHGYYAEPTAYDGAVTQVQGNLVATPVQDSYMLEITATADDPALAAAIANTAAETVIADIDARDQDEANTYRDFLKVQVDKASNDVTTASNAVQTFENANNLTNLNVELTLNAQGSNSVVNQLRDTDVNLAADKAKAAALQSSLDALSPTDSSTSTVTTGRSTTTLTNSVGNTAYSNLQIELADANSQVAALQAQHDSLSALLTNTASGQNDTLSKFQVLQLQLDAANGAYSALKQAYANAQLNSASTPLEVTKVDNAAPPLYPVSPLRYLFLLVGLVAGAIGGAGAGWIRDRRGPEPEPVEERAPRRGPAPRLEPVPQLLTLRQAPATGPAPARASRRSRVKSTGSLDLDSAESQRQAR